MRRYNEIFDWAYLAENRLKHPDDETAKLSLQHSQKEILHFFQYGTNIGGNPREESTEIGLVHAKRGSGKSTGCEVAVTMIAAEVPGSSIGCFATVEDNATELLERIKYFLNTSRYEPYRNLKPKRGEGKWKSQEIRLSNGSRVKTYTGSYKSIIGLHHHYGLIDEASRIPDELLFGAIIPKFSRIGRRWIMLSTPGQAKAGGFYECIQMYEEDKRLGNKPRFTYIYMDAVKDGFQSKQKVDLYKSITPDKYVKREYEAEFINEGGEVFSEDWIDYAMTRSHYPKYHNSLKNAIPNMSYCIGVDFGTDTTNTCIVAGHRNGEDKVIDYIHTFKPPINQTFKLTLDRLFSVMKYYPTSLLVPDATSGGAIVERIVERFSKSNYKCTIYSNKKRKINKVRKIGFWFDRGSKNDLINYLQNEIAKGTIVLPYHYDAVRREDPNYEIVKLKRELLDYRYEDRGGVYKVFGTQPFLDDRVEALAMCVLGLKNFKNYSFMCAMV